MSKTIIIAEAGVNHNGDIKKALQLVKAAYESGADIVKFQTFKTNEVVTQNACKADYQKKGDLKKESQKEMIEKLELSDSEHKILKDYCDEIGIEFLSTAFDLGSINFLNSYNLKRFKIPSGEINNFPFLRLIGSLGKPLILSTGMSNLSDIENAIEILENAGTLRNQITVLHCTTEYPAPIDEVNLNAMNSIAKAFGVKIGYSDHTLGIEVPIAAAALGATIIEKHITLDKNLVGPDHAASLEPHEFKAMIRAIRNIEKCLGDGIKRPSKSEIKNIPIARKFIVAAENIKKGEKFTDMNITAKRSSGGLNPLEWENIIGKLANKDFQKNDSITY